MIFLKKVKPQILTNGNGSYYSLENENKMSTAIMQSDVVHERVMRIIDQLKEVDVDGETMEYIIKQVGMEQQMLRQLVLGSDATELLELIKEKANLLENEKEPKNKW